MKRIIAPIVIAAVAAGCHTPAPAAESRLRDLRPSDVVITAESDAAALAAVAESDRRTAAALAEKAAAADLTAETNRAVAAEKAAAQKADAANTAAADAAAKAAAAQKAAADAGTAANTAKSDAVAAAGTAAAAAQTAAAAKADAAAAAQKADTANTAAAAAQTAADTAAAQTAAAAGTAAAAAERAAAADAKAAAAADALSRLDARLSPAVRAAQTAADAAAAGVATNAADIVALDRRIAGIASAGTVTAETERAMAAEAKLRTAAADARAAADAAAGTAAAAADTAAAAQTAANAAGTDAAAALAALPAKAAAADLTAEITRATAAEKDIRAVADAAKSTAQSANKTAVNTYVEVDRLSQRLGYYAGTFSRFPAGGGMPDSATVLYRPSNSSAPSLVFDCDAALYPAQLRIMSRQSSGDRGSVTMNLTQMQSDISRAKTDIGETAMDAAAALAAAQKAETAAKNAMTFKLTAKSFFDIHSSGNITVSFSGFRGSEYKPSKTTRAGFHVSAARAGECWFEINAVSGPVFTVPMTAHLIAFNSGDYPLQYYKSGTGTDKWTFDETANGGRHITLTGMSSATAMSTDRAAAYRSGVAAEYILIFYTAPETVVPAGSAYAAHNFLKSHAVEYTLDKCSAPAVRTQPDGTTISTSIVGWRFILSGTITGAPENIVGFVENGTGDRAFIWNPDAPFAAAQHKHIISDIIGLDKRLHDITDRLRALETK